MKTVIPFLLLPLTSAPDAGTEDEKSGKVAFEKPVRLGRVGARAVSECSGVVASRRNPGILWVHNDSGDLPRLFALRRDGHLLAEVRIRDAQARDWEDLALGPGPKKERDYLYIGDTGDNRRSRRELQIYLLPEPALERIEPGKTWESFPARTIRFTFAGGPFDCESLAVHPVSGDIYLFTKAPLLVRIHRLRGAASEESRRVHTAEHLRTLLTSDLVTAADIAPDGRHLLLRTYLGLYEFSIPEGRKFDEILGTRPAVIVPPRERQGEAACYTPEGSIITISEGVGAGIYELRRKKP